MRPENPFSDPPIQNQINIATMHPQSMKLYEHLMKGNSINFVQAGEMGITYLEKHIADLRRKITIHSRVIRIHNARCNEYSLQRFE